MIQCSFGADYVRSGYTSIDNLFLLSYLPGAPGTEVKVYLYGLTLASCADKQGETDHVEAISIALKLPRERVEQAFAYWEEKGLITRRGSEYLYRSPKAPVTPAIKLNAEKYAPFVEECARVFPEKALSENELLALIETMRECSIETDAMLMMMKYCVDSRAAASVPYVLKVAKDWASNGIKTLNAVEEHISELENGKEEMRTLFQALGKKSAPALDDRLLYLKWTKEEGFSHDVVLLAARSLKKRGGTERLDEVMNELKAAGCVSAEETERFLKEKASRFALAEEIVRMLGGSYFDYGSAVDTFITPWLKLGFDEAALKQIAACCFVSNYRSLDAMGRKVRDFYKLGLLTAPAVVAYVDEQVRLDGLIREVFDAALAAPVLTPYEREAYKTFTCEWGFEHEDVLKAARAVSGKPFPFRRLNRILSDARTKGISRESLDAYLKDLEEEAPRPKKKTRAEDEYIRADYTAEQLSSLFTTLDRLEDHL